MARSTCCGCLLFLAHTLSSVRVAQLHMDLYSHLWTNLGEGLRGARLCVDKLHRPPADERHSLFAGHPRKAMIVVIEVRQSVVMKDVETSVLLTSCLRVLVSVSGFGGDITGSRQLRTHHTTSVDERKFQFFFHLQRGIARRV
ncbi:uncharacterized protein LACBIDRAFT_331670 [Laccaria bicolor S238N-H82]|uniref:Predicted protein n=1 Tax=Laccaria bicolor (strain S238N-H82 / ATCC MYA-4686) TaxID=486041 RepID=B0DQ69_LACBS|nr:uncharacterized protein LACBIDRAFT_331670 [Laccaria bicolor S238N-H82]EDR03333.1 predicted protein [Laccaria bicolor S238N-H82]|eukprot:XP_001886129.1 predicted protein [Laccaria bicolor S238N-H82]